MKVGVSLKGSYLDQSFPAAEEKYIEVGLKSHPKKRVSGELNGVGLGCEFRGSIRLVGSESLRRIGLSQVSCQIARCSTVTGRFLRKVGSSWNYCSLYLRKLMALQGAVYKALPDVAEDLHPMLLSARCKDELLLFSVLSPMMVTNVRAQYTEDLILSDASESGWGVTQVFLSRCAQRTLAAPRV
ncbi:unnamed protein product [Polarella glacialis]|uniref:Uncharacterized protein n=1 Tax=Polarella glacialis TaxID=89957 RepID=A0A813GD33_POLGL|nr:unnamed protein product [Polarella glacialis]